MSSQRVNIKVTPSQRDKIRGECKKLFLQNNPKFRGMRLSDSFMIEKLIVLYLDPEI